MDVMCVLHDSDEYGVARWSLVELARAAGVSIKLLKELAAKNVLKGADRDCEAFVYTPRHAGKDGEPVTLIASSSGPCWYCSRMVRDEYVCKRRGEVSRFTTDNQPPKVIPIRPPKPPLGEPQGDGASSSASASKELLPSAAGNSTVQNIDPTKAMWDAGRALLGPKKAPLIGKMVKEHGTEAVMQAIATTVAAKPFDPTEYLAAVLHKRGDDSMTAVFRRGT